MFDWIYFGCILVGCLGVALNFSGALDAAARNDRSDTFAYSFFGLLSLTGMLIATIGLTHA
jgi:hypothetical protein